MSILNFLEEVKRSHPKMKEVIYYGGSFNPWHEGHSECVRKAPKDAFKIIIPDHNPHKKLREDGKLHLDESYIKSLGENIFIYKDFFLKKESNPTANWLVPLIQKFSQVEHALLIGYDSYTNFYKWKDSTALLNNLTRLYVLDRENVHQENLYSNIDIHFLGGHDFEDFSSSSIRENKK